MREFFKKFYRIAIYTPYLGAKAWLSLFLLTTATTYASAQFSGQHAIFPWLVAWMLAVGIEWTYLSGLYYADRTKSNWYVWPMIGVGALTSGLYAVLYILGVYSIIPQRPQGWIALMLALAHVVPLILLLFCYTLVKRQYAKEQIAHNEFLAELDRAERIRQDQRATLRLELERAKVDIAIQAARAKVAKVSSNSAHRVCPNCGIPLDPHRYAAAKKYGSCKACNPR